MQGFEDFVTEFKKIYNRGLPGKPGQAKMRPYMKYGKGLDLPFGSVAKKASVMALIINKNNLPHLIIIERTLSKGVHSGQLAFPGGRIEEGESMIDAAFREAFEEIGIPASAIELIGPLTDIYVLASRFLVYPYVGIISQSFEYKKESREVENIFEVPLSFFLDEKNIKEKKIKSKVGISLQAPYYDVESRVLWGATAMMIAELAAMLQQMDYFKPA